MQITIINNSETNLTLLYNKCRLMLSPLLEFKINKSKDRIALIKVIEKVHKEIKETILKNKAKTRLYHLNNKNSK